jgi:hypothetical protein
MVALSDEMDMDIIHQSFEALKETTEAMENKIQSLTYENIQLRHRADRAVFNNNNNNNNKAYITNKLIEAAMPNLDMYSYEVNFDKVGDIRSYSFNGYYVSNEVYSLIIDDDEITEDDEYTICMMVPYPLDDMKCMPRISRLPRRYNEEINKVGEFVRKGRLFITYHIKLAPDCYVAFLAKKGR